MEIKRFGFGTRIITNSVIKEYPYVNTNELNELFTVKFNDGEYSFKMSLDKETQIFGLGENVKGINKRGSLFTSFNMDDPVITEDRKSLYASHNFLIIRGEKTFGIFVDTPKVVEYDLGFYDLDKLEIKTEDGFDLYIIETNKDEIDVIKQFREMIGKSYIAPYFAFGVAQSRWGYKNKQDLDDVINGFKEKNLPLDMLFVDIDCLDNFKDFTFNQSFYKDGKINKSYFDELKNNHLHLIPIVDAAVKVEDGYFMYDDLVKNNACSRTIDNKPYIVGVWPGDSVLPDYFSQKGQEIFGQGYKKYLDLGIDGFWNDMNEPALFYGKKCLNDLINYLKNLDYDNADEKTFFDVNYRINSLKNNMEDYKNIYHLYDLEYKDNNLFNHYDVHNMYGYKMVESASLYFDKYNKENNLKKKYLLFSRSSMIGSHRYGGIWTGDNAAYWDHLLLNIKMMPSLNMCGYLYSGADIGGFGQNASLDLLLRWMAFGIFTPLFRNHTCNWVRPKDYHLMKNTDTIRNLLSIRYALVPYLYTSYLKAIDNNELLFTPLSFKYKEDKRVFEIENQLLFGDSIMIAPVYKQNAKGRMVYLPEDMLEIRMTSGNRYSVKEMKKGDHYIDVNIDEVVFFLLDKKVLPLAKVKDNIKNITELNNDDFNIINNHSNLKTYEIKYEENDEIKTKIIKLS